MRRIGVNLYARVDGCQVGFRTSTGGIPLKSFIVATSDQTLYDILNSVRCDKSLAKVRQRDPVTTLPRGLASYMRDGRTVLKHVQRTTL